MSGFNYNQMETLSILIDGADNVYIYLGMMVGTERIIVKYLSADGHDIESSFHFLEKIKHNFGAISKQSLEKASGYTDLERIMNTFPEYFL